MKLIDNKEMVYSNAWRSHCETTEGLKKSRGKVYLLLLGQCTQVLVDKMKQDTTWVTVSELFDPILLFKLIKSLEKVRQPIQNGGIDSQVAYNLILLPRQSGAKCNLLQLIYH